MRSQSSACPGGMCHPFAGHVCLVNSFFGLDMPCALPANVILTGSTAARSGKEKTALKETSDETLGLADLEAI